MREEDLQDTQYTNTKCEGTPLERGDALLRALFSARDGATLSVGFGTAEGQTVGGDISMLGIVAVIVEGKAFAFSAPEARGLAKSIVNGLKACPGAPEELTSKLDAIADAMVKSAKMADELDLKKLQH